MATVTRDFRIHKLSAKRSNGGLKTTRKAHAAKTKVVRVSMDDIHIQGMKRMVKKPKFDLINHPQHYTRGKFETIDVLEDIITAYTAPKAAFNAGQVIKYVSRAPYKGGKQDLLKARWYLDRLMKYVD